MVLALEDRGRYRCCRQSREVVRVPLPVIAAQSMTRGTTVILNDSVRGAPNAEMTEHSRVPGAPTAEMT